MTTRVYTRILRDGQPSWDRLSTLEHLVLAAATYVAGATVEVAAVGVPVVLWTSAGGLWSATGQTSTEVLELVPSAFETGAVVTLVGVVVVPPVVAPSALPEGASTAANQILELAALAEITTPADVQPVSGVITGTVTSTPSGTQNVNLTQVAGAAVTAGAGVIAAGTQRVVLADDQPSVTVDAPVGTPVAARLSDGAAFLTTAGGRLAVDGSGVTQPVSGTVTANAGTDLNTSLLATQATLATRVADATITARLGVLGQANMAGSTPVVIASNQSAVPVSGTVAVTATDLDIRDLTHVSDSVRIGDGTDLALVTAAGALVVDGSAVTQPVSAASLPLPTGAATEATLATRAASAQLPAALVGGRLDVVVGAALPAGANNIGDVDVLTMPGTVVEDAVSASGATSVLIAGVRNDAAAAKTDADGDYSNLALDAAGRVGIADLGGSITVDGTVTANAGTNLNTALLALESGGNLATLAGVVSAARAAVNPISGQVGVQGASGVVTALTQRMVLATDVALPTGANVIGQVTANAGTNLNTSALALEAGNLATLAGIVSASRGAVNPISGQAGVQGASGVVTALTQRMVLATDVALPTGANVIGQVTANAGTNLNTSALALAATQTDRSQFVKITDGTRDATVRDTGASDSLNVAIVDASGNQITTFGGGTEYTTDVAAPAAPVGGTILAERDDQLAALTEVEGDWTNARATSKGALWVAIADSAGDPITSFGGGTQYAEDTAKAAGEQVTMAGVIRADTAASQVDTDGDRTELIVDGLGQLHTTNASIGASADTGKLYTQIAGYRVDAVAQIQPILVTAAAGMHSNLRDATGAETGVAAVPLQVSLANHGANATAVKVDGSAVTQPVSAASLPLPTGASTLAEQQTQTTALQLIDNLPHAMNAAFSNAVAVGGQLDDAAITDATENNIAPARITAKRALHMNLRDVAGTETGVAALPLQVSLANTGANGTAVTIAGAVTNTVLSVVGGGTEAAAQRVTIANDSTGVLSVDDNGGSITVDAPVATPVAVRVSDGAAFIAPALEGGNLATLAGIVTAARGAVNPISGQAGVQGASGVVTALTQRVVLATDVALPTGANTIGAVTNAVLSVVGGGVEATAQRVTIASDSTGVLSVDDNNASITVDAPVGTPVAARLSDGAAFYDGTKTGQLPAALVGGRLDANVGAWLGSTAPSVGSKTSANSVPVVIASDQGAVAVTAAQGTAANLKAEVVGTRTNDNAVPGATNVGALVAVAAAAAPVRNEGNLGALRTTLAGDLVVTLDSETVTLAAGTNRVGGAYEVGGTVIDEVPTARAINRTFLNATASGNTQIVATQGVGVRIRVLAIFVVTSTAVSFKLQSAASDITATFPCAANGGMVLPETPHGWCQTNANEALNVNLSGAVTNCGVQVIWTQAS